MKDINQAGLDLGLSEANKLLAKRVARGRMSPNTDGRQVLNSIDPTLTYTGFDRRGHRGGGRRRERESQARMVLAETEKEIDKDAVLASNTSTISITRLAEAPGTPRKLLRHAFLQPGTRHAAGGSHPRREDLRCNAVARTVAYANKMGKKAIVVNDCPGFLVNRVLFPYFGGFNMLVRDGADFQAVDKVMERWGWPMGPAYLIDVVGIDTGVHCQQRDGGGLSRTA